jgi:hypothetical protein
MTTIPIILLSYASLFAMLFTTTNYSKLHIVLSFFVGISFGFTADFIRARADRNMDFTGTVLGGLLIPIIVALFVG